MDKADISQVVDELNELKPSTEYAEFLTIWPQIENALQRQNKRKDIWQLLKNKGHLSVSYVTFTRFVKKALEQNNSIIRDNKAVPIVGASISPSNIAAPDSPPNFIEEASNQVHQSEAAAALSRAQKISTSTDYARIARQSSKKNT